MWPLVQESVCRSKLWLLLVLRSSRDTNSPVGLLMSFLNTGSLGCSYEVCCSNWNTLSFPSVLHSLLQPWQLVQIDMDSTGGQQPNLLLADISCILREHQRFYIGQSNQFWQKSKRKSCGEKKHIELVWNQKSLRLQHSVLPACHRCAPHEETESSVRSLHSFYIFPKLNLHFPERRL